MIVNKAFSYKEAEDFDIRFWRRAGTAQRFIAAWLMVEDWLRMRGQSEGLLRLAKASFKIKQRIKDEKAPEENLCLYR